MNAMRDCIDGDYIANDIRMTRTQDRRAVLVVEGDTDELFFEPFIDTTRCRLVVANGRENAVYIFTELQNTSFAGALVIVDADFDVLMGCLPLPMGLLFTDSHDLEMMLMASPALDKVLRQVGKKEKLASFLARYGDLRKRLLASAKPLGCFLWLSRQEALNLRFDELKYGKFVDDKTLEVDTRKMIKTVLDHSNRRDLTEKLIAARLAALNDGGYDPWHLCCGHHMSQILAIAFRKAIGSYNAGEVDVEQVEQMLKLAYEDVYFRSTELYADIRLWESLTPPYMALKPKETAKSRDL
jgi:hypothetical protein